MARIRTIKPELFISETLALVSLQAERTFTGLLTQADDRGRMRDSSAILNGALWPCRPEHTIQDMTNDIDELVGVGLLCRYTVDNKKYLHFPTWDEHQKISHPSTRNLAPPCPTHGTGHGFQEDLDIEALMPPKVPAKSVKNKVSGNSPEGSGNTPQGKERKGREKEEFTAPTIVYRGVPGGEEEQKEEKQRSATPHATGADAPYVLKTEDASISEKVQKKAAPRNRRTPRTTGGKAPSLKANTVTTREEQEEDMGVYDVPVDPFTDLRKEGGVTRNKKAVGINGVEPRFLPDVEKVIEHFSTAHKAIGTKFRVTNIWYSDTQALLRGTDAVEPFTADQLCDLIDFGVHHPFWHSHLTNPAGLRKHGPKLFGSDDYIAWSLTNKRPAANRPRNNLIKAAAEQKPVRGQLGADAKRSAEDYKAPL